MKKVRFILFISLLTVAYMPVQSREHLRFDAQWKFIHADTIQAENPDFDDSKWRVLDLPHDWSIEYPYDRNAPAGGNGGFVETGTGWYRKHLTVDPEAIGKTVWIEFDGIYMNSDVWVNSRHAGSHPYGYTGFYYDISSLLSTGDNVIAVRVDNSKQPNSHWYTGSGIYRHVWLTVTEPVHIGHWGTCITTPEVAENQADVSVATTIENSSEKKQNITLLTILVDPYGNQAGYMLTKCKLKANRSISINQDIRIANPLLWSPKQPSLYTAVQEVRKGDMVIDRQKTTFGIRSMVYDANRGFFLNDIPVKMKGANLHQDGGCVGAAVPEQVWERRLELLKSMGCNAIRTAHNPPAPEFLDLCDRMGFLVIDEAFDEWRIGKCEYGYHLYFDEWGKRDLVSMLHRDRNHPSVVLWSIGNKIPEQGTHNGLTLLTELQDICHQEDPTRPVTLGCSRTAADSASIELTFTNALDIVGYNFPEHGQEHRESCFSTDHRNHPDWKMIGLESISLGGIRGETNPNDSSEIQTPRNLIRAQELWKAVHLNNYVIGDFIWTGIDYLGGASWPFKQTSTGAIDICGFPKDAYYFYQSLWRDEPTIHLFPHWNRSEPIGRKVPVFCYTNCSEVELFVNGKSFGVRRIEFSRQDHDGTRLRSESLKICPSTADLFIKWDVPYEPGIVKAVGKRDGQIVCTQEIHTAGEPAAVRLIADRHVSRADERDLTHLTVEIVDKNGYVVPNAENRVQFFVAGPGRLIGVDNGDPDDHSSCLLNERHAFHGLCLALVQSNGSRGEIEVIAISDSLKEASVKITVK